MPARHWGQGMLPGQQHRHPVLGICHPHSFPTKSAVVQALQVADGVIQSTPDASQQIEFSIAPASAFR